MDKKHRHRKHKQFSDAGNYKDNTHNSVSEYAEMCHKLNDDLSCFEMSKNDTSLANSSFSDHLTLYEIYVLEQERCKNEIKSNSFSELSQCTDKNDNFGTGSDVTTGEPSFSNQLTLHELFETQGHSWRNRESPGAKQKNITTSDNKENDRDCNNYLSLYELYQMQGLESSSQRKNLTQREFILSPVNKEFYAQCRKNRMDKIPEWIKSVWKKQSSQQKCEETVSASCSEKETIKDDEQCNSLKHKSFYPSGNHVQEKLNETGNMSIHMQQSIENQQIVSVNPAYKVVAKSAGNADKKIGKRDVNSSSTVTETLKLSERHESFVDSESVLSSTSDDGIPLSQLSEKLSEKYITHKEKNKIEEEDCERLAVQNTKTLSVKEKSFNGNMDEEQPAVQQWTEWSVKLLKNRQLCITGRCNGVSSISEDISQWKRIDAHTLKNPKKGIVYKLVGIADHYIGPDFPAVIRKKFQNGFPEDWLEVVKQWNDIQHKGENVKQTELWLESYESDVSDACAPTAQWHSPSLNASKIRNQQKLKYAKMVVKEQEFSHPGNSSFRTLKNSRMDRRDIQQQPKLYSERDGTRGTNFPRKDQASHQLKYKVTLRTVPDVLSSFDETDTSFA